MIRSCPLGGWPYGDPVVGPFEINRNSPQFSGLVAWATFVDGVPRFFPRNVKFTSGTESWGKSRLGGSIYGDGTQALDLDAGEFPSIQAPGSFVVRVTPLSQPATAQNELVRIRPSSGVGFIQFFQDGFVGDKMGARIWASDWGGRTHEQNAYTVGVHYVYAATWEHDGSDYSLALIKCGPEGIETDTDTETRQLVDPLNEFCFFGDVPGHDHQLSAHIHEVRVYDYRLSEREVWCMWTPGTRWELYKPISPYTFALVTEAARVPRHPAYIYQIPAIV